MKKLGNGQRSGKGTDYFLNKDNIKKRNENIKKEENHEIPNIETIEYFDNGNIKFEGEYFEGKRWNGKLFNEKGKEEFEIKEGNGKGKEYDEYGELIFDGEYLKGEKWNGKGKVYNYKGE